MGRHSNPSPAGPDDPIFKRGFTIYTLPSARPKPSPEKPKLRPVESTPDSQGSIPAATTEQRNLQAMGTYEGLYSELGIEPPEPVSILTGRNIVPGSKKKSPDSPAQKAREEVAPSSKAGAAAPSETPAGPVSAERMDEA